MAKRPTKADLEAENARLKAALTAEARRCDKLEAELRPDPERVKRLIGNVVHDGRPTKRRKLSRVEVLAREDRARRMRDALRGRKAHTTFKCGNCKAELFSADARCECSEGE